MYRRNKVISNQYPVWKYIAILVVMLIAFIYALPNMYGELSSIQLSKKSGDLITQSDVETVTQLLDKAHIPFLKGTQTKYVMTVNFKTLTDQIKAKTLLQEHYAKTYTIALNLMPNTPHWLAAIGATPMHDGLDLRGGMYFLLQADLNSAITARLNGMITDFRTQLQDKNIHYTGLSLVKGAIQIRLRDDADMQKVQDYLASNYVNMGLEVSVAKSPKHTLNVVLSESAINEIKSNAVDQVLVVMRNRVNALGVAEASVAKSGDNRVVIELPGVQDAAQAKQVLGGTATVHFQLVNEKLNQNPVLSNLQPGSSLFESTDGRPVILYDRVLLTGNAIDNAVMTYSQESSQPVVSIRISGPEVSYFSKQTAENIGKAMATVLVQTNFVKKKITKKQKDGTLKLIKTITVPKVVKKVISVATIQSQLGNSFEIRGLNQREAENLALMIRSGSLPTPVQIVQEQQVGPSLGAANIKMGAISILIALVLVILFMLFYYSVFGLIANIALIGNLILIVAIMSIIPGATLSLPGIAAIVLHLGMAIDGNVLIFERIREELRNGMPVQSAIHAGYERAFGTIVDSNVTTLIVAIILFAIGEGSVKGFALVLIIGIMTSMFTSVTVSRAITNLLYGKKRNLTKLPIGI